LGWLTKKAIFGYNIGIQLENKEQMMFVVYHKETTQIVGSRVHNTWKSLGAAKAHLSRMGKMGYNVNEYDIASHSFFSDNIEKTVTRRNLMTGKEFTESVNTPYYCSPSSESYWSM
jgi:hypothetical protein